MTTPAKLPFPIRLGPALAAIALLAAVPAFAADTEPAAAAPSADEAWSEVQRAAQPPVFPAEWESTPPSAEVLESFGKTESKRLLEAAEKARAFQTQYPDHPNAQEARMTEYRMLEIAQMMGAENVGDRQTEIEQAMLKDPDLDDDSRIQLRVKAIEREAMRHEDEGRAAVIAAFEKGVRELQKEFPTHPMTYQILLQIAMGGDADASERVAKEIVASESAPEEIKEQARTLLDRSKLVGSELPIRFTSLDGREVDLTEMKGKVVLVDFWATWCGPCVAELPNVKAAYEALHPKGFEIVGISFDQSRERLEQFIKEHEMPWPQYFDGKGWQNEIGEKYGINSIPAMWLVGKDGKVRDLNARDDLVAKVEKLLAE